MGEEEAAALAVAADGRQRRLVQALRGLAQQLGLQAEVAGGQLQRLVIEGLAAELVAQLRLVGGQAVQGGDGEQAGEGGVGRSGSGLRGDGNGIEAPSESRTFCGSDASSGVSKIPGAIDITRTPLPASSRATGRVRATIPPFEAA